MPDDPISREVFIWQTLRERVAAQYEMDEADESLVDTLDGMTTLNERLVALALSAKQDEAFAEAIKAIKSDMDLRIARFQRSAEHKRSHIAWAMQETGQKNIMAPAITLSVRMGQPKIIVDETRLSDDYKKSKVTTSKDLDAIKAAISAGTVPEGVQISNAEPSLTIRRK